ncbi:MAG TPA: TetR/AcrR family transcriptional regulator [Actinomycetota bacterium]|jgi:AcrR family transcriptional regulator|nr:TetR/AcrR family transcriptional regulator [Actinomycetota bacterium]
MSVQARARTRRQPRYSAEARRTHLLDVAHDLCERHGTSGVTIERLAETAGVSRTLVYQHFTSSSDVLLRLLEREREWLQSDIDAGLARASTFEEKLRAVIRPFLMARRERGASVLHTFLAESSPDVVATAASAWLERWGHFWVDEAVAAFGIDPDLAQDAVVIYRGAFFATQRMVWRDQADPKRLEDMLVTIVMSSLPAISEAC